LLAANFIQLNRGKPILANPLPISTIFLDCQQIFTNKEGATQIFAINQPVPVEIKLYPI
jgi:hypothetical protein